MGPNGNPNNPALLQQGMAAADRQPDGDVGQVCETCPDNWVEAGAVDESTGKPIPGIGYRIYDLARGDRVASGVLDNEGTSPRHNIPMPVTQLYVIFGTEEAMNEAEGNIKEMQRQRALESNTVQNWRGFDAGLDKDEFSRQHRTRIENGDFVDEDRGFLGGAASGAQALWDLGGSILSGDSPREWAEKEYARRRDDAWEQYQIATGARAPTGGESFGAAVPQGATFGFDEEIGARLASLFDNRSYEEIVASHRQVLQQHQIANPGAYLGGELVGALPTVFVPVGGAAANAARAGQGASGTMIAGARTGAATGALSGAGHDEGGVIDRLDGAALGAATGGLAGAVLSGAGVLIARGVSRTRIWGKIATRQAGKFDDLQSVKKQGLSLEPRFNISTTKLERRINCNFGMVKSMIAKEICLTRQMQVPFLEAGLEKLFL